MRHAAGAFAFVVMGVSIVVLLGAVNAPAASPAVWLLAGIAGTLFVLMFLMFVMTLIAVSKE